MKTAATLAPGIKHIPFNGKLHQLILSNFNSRLKLARDEQRKKREEQWRESEDTFTAFMPERDVDAVRKSERKQGNVDYTTISIPYSYADRKSVV